MLLDPSPPHLCGVRLRRGGPVVFVDANGHDVGPPQVVVVDLAGRESVAMVVFSPSQLIANEPGVGSAGRLLRVATPEESVEFGAARPDHGKAAARPFTTRTEWLVVPDDEPEVKLAIAAGATSTGELIERVFPGEREEASRRRTGSPGKPGEA